MPRRFPPPWTVEDHNDACFIVKDKSGSVPPPWTVEDHNDACFIVKDKSGSAVAYVYYEEEPGRRSAPDHQRTSGGRRYVIEGRCRRVERSQHSDCTRR